MTVSEAEVRRTASLGRACIGLFAVSTAFPIVAGTMPSVQQYELIGLVDVGVAFALIMIAAIVASRARHRVNDTHQLIAQRVSRVVVTVIPGLLVLFFVAGDRLDWTVLLVGLGWRAWLLLYTLPYLAAALRERQ